MFHLIYNASDHAFIVYCGRCVTVFEMQFIKVDNRTSADVFFHNVGIILSDSI